MSSMYGTPSRGRLTLSRDKLAKISETQSITTYMQAIKSTIDSLAMVCNPFSDDEVIFHVLNALGTNYKEICTVIRAHNTSITFEELHDKLADYKAYLQRKTPGSDRARITPNFVVKPGNQNKK